MTILERIANELEEKILKASDARANKPTVLFCGCNPQIKKDMHRRAKRIGLNPSYSIKHPSIRVELQNNRRIKIDKYNTTTIDYDHFEFICRYLEK